MPFCPTHGTPLIYDLYGNAECERCAVARKADEARRCRVCSAPVPEPGLCPSCRRLAAPAQGYQRLGSHAGWLTLAILLLGLALLASSFLRDFLPAIKQIKEAPADNPGQSTSGQTPRR